MPLASAVWGAVFGYLSLWLVYHAYRLATGKEGMGYGDFKLLAALGAWLGADYLIAIVLVSSLVGAILGSLLLLIGKLAHKDVPIPSAPSWRAPGSCASSSGPILCGNGSPSPFPWCARPETAAHAMRIGLTGGIGSGKSTVASMLVARRRHADRHRRHRARHHPAARRRDAGDSSRLRSLGRRRGRQHGPRADA